MNKLLLSAALLGTALQTISLSAHADQALQAAISGSHRSPANVARDPARHPLETLQFFGIRPDMTVVELSPGGGWYTEILAPYLRQNGKLIAAANDPASDSDYGKRAYARLRQKLDANPAIYDQVSTGIFEPPKKISYATPGSVDMVLTFRNIHNWIPAGEANVQEIFNSAYRSLKSGGVFGIVEHRLPASRTQDEKASSGYVHQSYVIRLAERAGFKLAGSSEINANPKDKADHEGGVWALPPTYANKDKDRANYESIGESDRMTLKFIKP
ncbi:MAG: class I SAM-dependent methyltransferase [Undibacterium curvum]|uniref:class I SAM-dependent methyltransferase n=1 Tax=Undibacterium curvum TaxID=2762294 RepID=UPI003BC1BE19